jgi:tetratricopeptide (TPR) repeat protein
MKRGEWQQAESAFLEADVLLAETRSSRRNLNRYYLAQLYFLLGDPEKAKLEAGAALEYCQRVGEKNTHAFVRMFQGMVAEMQGILADALRDQLAFLELMKEIGTPRHIAWGYALTGRLHYLTNHRDAALGDLRNGIEIVKECCEEPGDLSYFFMQIGGLFVQRYPDVAVRFLSFTQSLGANQKDPIFYKPYFDCFLAAARGSLSEVEFESAWEEGAKLSTDAAIGQTMMMLEEL